MIDLYSSATPNGRKVTIMLEELGVKYNTIAINLDKKEQFSKQFSRISAEIYRHIVETVIKIHPNLQSYQS